MTAKKKIYYSFSKYNRAKQCQLKYYDAHVNKDISVNPAHDNQASYVGIMVQHIFECVVNNRDIIKETINKGVIGDAWDAAFDELCALIDKDLKLLWWFIKPLSSFEHDFDTQETFPISFEKDGTQFDAVLLESSTICAYDESKFGNEFHACNSVIKKIRELYKNPLRSFLLQFNLDEIQCEVKRNGVEIELDEEGYDDYIVCLKGTMDFLWHPGNSQRYAGSKGLILDGKKSLGSFLDPKQLLFYTIMEGDQNGDWMNYMIDSAFWGWKEDKYMEDKETGRPFCFTPEQRVELIKDIIDTHKSMEHYTKESDYIAKPEYSSCMFCDRRDNCIGRGAIPDIDEI